MPMGRGGLPVATTVHATRGGGWTVRLFRICHAAAGRQSQVDLEAGGRC